ncbi:MAG TPA: hypothetical protein VLB51_10400 [Methylomirabilota bacterium]|nr:hypothetical protein [Methylomirabilota bacterium]
MSATLPSAAASPVVAAVTMGYGHLRAAAAIADELGVELALADRAPLASWAERRLWGAARTGYHALSRLSQSRRGSAVFGSVLDRITVIDGRAPGSRTPGAVRALDRLVRLGLGATFGRRLTEASSPLVTTFYAVALAAERHSPVPVACVVTDSDIHRVWAPARPATSRVRYLVPAPGTADRLRSYGVDAGAITVTGFPLPPELVGGDDLEALHGNLEARLLRLRRRSGPLAIVVAIGGAGAHADRAVHLARELEDRLADGRLRLTLAAGTRTDVAARFRQRLATGLTPAAARAVDVLHEPRFDDAYRGFNRVLAAADALWTKPSELVFYGALGLPLILEPPVGDHERRNRELVVAAGVAVDRPAAGGVGPWLDGRLGGGWFAEAACRGPENLHPGGARAIAGFVSRELYGRFTRP